MSMAPTPLQRFRDAYAEHRADEGRGAGGTTELLALPYLRTGPQVRAWRVRARTYECFLESVVSPRAAGTPAGRLRVLDVGAGNGWLCYRLCGLGHDVVALDVRADHVDGLGAAAGYAACLPTLFPRVAASFEALPLRAGSFDLVVFNASLHYATRLETALAEAVRCVAAGGSIVIMDSPWYAREQDGAAMVAEKHAAAAARFGDRADALLGIGSIEYLTPSRMRLADPGVRLAWRQHRVRYPLWYELRPLAAALRQQRRPSRFDIWEATIP